MHVNLRALASDPAGRGGVREGGEGNKFGLDNATCLCPRALAGRRPMGRDAATKHMVLHLVLHLVRTSGLMNNRGSARGNDLRWATHKQKDDQIWSKMTQNDGQIWSKMQKRQKDCQNWSKKQKAQKDCQIWSKMNDYHPEQKTGRPQKSQPTKHQEDNQVQKTGRPQRGQPTKDQASHPAKKTGRPREGQPTKYQTYTQKTYRARADTSAEHRLHLNSRPRSPDRRGRHTPTSGWRTRGARRGRLRRAGSPPAGGSGTQRT